MSKAAPTTADAPVEGKPSRRPLFFFRPPGQARLLTRLAIAIVLLAALFAVPRLITRQSIETPVVVAFEPDMVKDVPVQSPITVRFNTPMNQHSVEAAFKVEPQVPGRLSWEGNALVFQPDAPGFKRSTKYTVAIADTALRASQQPLPAAFEASFVAAANLTVLSVQPFKDSVEVVSDSLISVQFNNPVASLTAPGASQIDPLVIAPPVEGKGKWLTSSVYTFRPTNGLVGSTQYTVTVRAGLADTGGSALATDYTWTFKTELPAVTTISPAADGKFVNITSAITATFNQPLDHASLQTRFHLVGKDGREVPGGFSWSGDSTVVFTPGRELDHEATYTIKIDSGVLRAKGSIGMAKEFSSSFTTVALPRLTSIQPDNGANVTWSDWIVLTFNQPMDRASVVDKLEIIPRPTRVFTYWADSDTKLRVSGVITQPSFHYRLTLNAGALDRYGQRLATGKTVEFDTQPLPPAINLRVPGGGMGAISVSTTKGTYALFDAVNVDLVRVKLSAVDKDKFISLTSKPGSEQDAQLGQLLRQWEIPVNAGLNDTKVISTALTLSSGADLPSGLYAVDIEAPQLSAGALRRGGIYRGLVTVSRNVVTVKSAASEAIAWVADQVSGEPVRDASVTLLGANGQILAAGKTGADGTFAAKALAAGGDRVTYAVAEKDGDTAVASTNWSSDLSAYMFNLPYRSTPSNYALALYTDRPIYRPGDKVYFKGVSRSDDDGKYSLPPADQKLSFAIRDPRYRFVFSRTLSLDEYGAFDGEFPLDQEAATGNYTIQASFGDLANLGKPTMNAEIFNAGFLVAEFRKPDFEVKLAADRKEYIQGDAISVTVQANYFFGAPLANTKVTWQVFQRPFDFKGPQDIEGGPYSFSDFDQSGSGPTFNPGPRPIASGEGKTGAAGSLTFQLRADIAKETTGQTFTFEATATDLNNQQVSGRSEAVIHKGTYYAGVRPNPRVVVAGKPASAEIVTVDTQGVTVPNALLNVDLIEQKWYSVQEKGADGRFYWTSKVESTPVASVSARTDATGKTTASLVPPRAGSYKILVTDKDERGNEVRSSTLFYASGSEMVYWRVENHDRIELIADRPGYKPGDTARVLIPSPYPKARALLTIERGHILDYKLVDIQSSSQLVDIPIDAAYEPNVYVSMVILRSEQDGAGKADFKVGYVELPVQADEKKLTITITPDKPRYQPRETATYKIKTTDFKGRPVQAELSLALVDASVLSLAEERVREMFDSFYGRRPLSVNTGQTLSRSLNKIDPQAFGYGKGGGGEPGDPRGFFPDVAYWNPALKTDRNGEATVTVPLPDSLTTWRLTARGTTVDTIVGTERNDILVSKQIMVRPVVPRFFVAGDEARLEAIVHNYTSESLDIDVSLAGEGVALSGQATQRAKVPPAGSTKANWTAKAGGDREAKLTFEARPVLPAMPKDAVQISLPILTYTTPETAATSGEVRTTITEVVALPAGVNRDLGELTVKLEPSLAAGMQEGLRFLEEYPFECVEQTISRFLPNIATLRALKVTGSDDSELKQKLPSLVTLSVQRLYRAQNPDGSWGWWPSDSADPFITAYALYGLDEAKREGFAVQAQVMEKAAGYLTGYLARSKDVYAPENANLRAYILYVLAGTNRGDRSTTIALYEQREALGRYGRAYLALALLVLNNGQADSRVQNLVEDLSSSAIASATGVHWEETAYDYKTMNTNNRTTSIVLDALVRADPANALIPGAVRWLMVSRKDGHWETTQESAMAVLALTDYLVASGELDASYSYEVALNGKKVGGNAVARANVRQDETLSIGLPGLLVDEANKLRISRYPSPGESLPKGRLYYSLYLRYFQPAQNIEARSEGIVVLREYLDANDRPVSGAALGSTVKVKLTIMAQQDLHYVAVEDPLPAGAEAVDPALKTTSLTARTAGNNAWRFNLVDIRDDKVAFFATFLPKGTYEYTYLIHATTAGAYQVLPLTAYEMYFPEVWGRSRGETFRVEG
ncbi:MAG: Ig-like domain-containing protein [Chloroflexi bacterium]|nr:Ig-like domain-containing protein [Chloroflexota bacterium]